MLLSGQLFFSCLTQERGRGRRNQAYNTSKLDLWAENLDPKLKTSSDRFVIEGEEKGGRGDHKLLNSEEREYKDRGG